MIGLLNVPCETPVEYYAAPTSSTIAAREACRPSDSKSFSANAGISGGHHRLTQKSSIGSVSSENTSSSQDTRESSPIFERRKRRVNYLNDGRKMFDGNLTESSRIPVPKLWEQLLVRSFVHKIEDEIASPVKQLSEVEKQFSSFNLQEDGRASSTLSLVSAERVEDACPYCSYSANNSAYHSHRFGGAKEPPSTIVDDAVISVARPPGMPRQSKSVDFVYDCCGAKMELVARSKSTRKCVTKSKLNGGSCGGVKPDVELNANEEVVVEVTTRSWCK